MDEPVIPVSVLVRILALGGTGLVILGIVVRALSGRTESNTKRDNLVTEMAATLFKTQDRVLELEKGKSASEEREKSYLLQIDLLLKDASDDKIELQKAYGVVEKQSKQIELLLNKLVELPDTAPLVKEVMTVERETPAISPETVAQVSAAPIPSKGNGQMKTLVILMKDSTTKKHVFQSDQNAQNALNQINKALDEGNETAHYTYVDGTESTTVRVADVQSAHLEA